VEKLKPAATVKTDPYRELKGKIHNRIVDEMSKEENKAATGRDTDRKTLEEVVGRLANIIMDEEPVPVIRAEMTVKA
jgi:pilus assembly protein CpaF